MERGESVRAHDESGRRGTLRGHRRQEARGDDMDQGTLVDPQVQDGRRLLERLSAQGIPVAAAAWVKESEGGPWYLYIVTPLVPEDGGKLPVYRRLIPVIRQMPQPFWVDPMDFKV